MIGLMLSHYNDNSESAGKEESETRTYDGERGIQKRYQRVTKSFRDIRTGAHYDDR